MFLLRLKKIGSDFFFFSDRRRTKACKVHTCDVAISNLTQPQVHPLTIPSAGRTYLPTNHVAFVGTRLWAWTNACAFFPSPQLSLGTSELGAIGCLGRLLPPADITKSSSFWALFFRSYTVVRTRHRAHQTSYSRKRGGLISYLPLQYIQVVV